MYLLPLVMSRIREIVKGISAPNTPLKLAIVITSMNSKNIEMTNSSRFLFQFMNAIKHVLKRMVLEKQAVASQTLRQSVTENNSANNPLNGSQSSLCWAVSVVLHIFVNSKCYWNLKKIGKNSVKSPEGSLNLWTTSRSETLVINKGWCRQLDVFKVFQVKSSILNAPIKESVWR